MLCDLQGDLQDPVDMNFTDANIRPLGKMSFFNAPYYAYFVYRDAFGGPKQVLRIRIPLSSSSQ